MANDPLTRPSLLVRLRDRLDEDAWREFVDLYGPLVYRFGRKRGLQDADAADLTQVVLQAVAGAIGRLEYDPRRGTFRGWLYGIVRHHLSKLLRGKSSQQQTGAATAVLEQPAPADVADDVWEQEYRRQRFLWAAGRARPHFGKASWQAFWRTAVDGLDARDAAAELGMSVGAVYTAKSRVLDRIKREIDALQEE